MSKNIRILSLIAGSAALAALISATPATAQGVPAGLLRLDSAQAFHEFQISDAQQSKLRSSYAMVRKHHARAH